MLHLGVQYAIFYISLVIDCIIDGYSPFIFDKHFMFIALVGFIRPLFFCIIPITVLGYLWFQIFEGVVVVDPKQWVRHVLLTVTALTAHLVVYVLSYLSLMVYATIKTPSPLSGDTVAASIHIVQQIVGVGYLVAACRSQFLLSLQYWRRVRDDEARARDRAVKSSG